MQLDGRVTASIASPGKHREAEVDDGRVERVHRIGEIDGQRFVDVEIARRPNETLRDICVDAPIARLVRIRPRGSRHPRTDADVIELGLHGAETRFDIAEALAIDT